MPSIEITRRRRNLSNGEQRIIMVFYISHADGYVMRKSFNLWKSYGLMEGGDYYKHINSKGVINQYRICITCGLNPQDGKKDLCSQCAKKHEEKQDKNMRFYKFDSGNTLPPHMQRLVTTHETQMRR